MLELFNRKNDSTLYMMVPIEQVFCLKFYVEGDGSVVYQVLWMNEERGTTEIDQRSFLACCDKFEKYHQNRCDTGVQ